MCSQLRPIEVYLVGFTGAQLTIISSARTDWSQLPPDSGLVSVGFRFRRVGT